ncbi:MAG: hypothetical protein H0V82_12640 [Candidatus Protochlamydia sp.]|nr:hypothetical protein [Candidatus Protochlamydia sp.]
MDKKGWMMLRVLINRYNPKAGEGLLKFLPRDEAQTLISHEIQSSEIEPILYQPQKILERLHYSWIKPLLKKFPKSMHSIVAGALTKEQAAGLTSSAPIKLSPPVKTFFVRQLYSLLAEEERLPYDYLPETDMSPLGTWKKRKLTMLFDFLGLHDLASEVRHIVNKKHLKNIYASLSPKQLYYLNVCLHQKEGITGPKLRIDPTNEDPSLVKNAIHRRGLMRFGKALCGQHPDFVWYIAHTLDTGRGEMVLKAYKPDSEPQVTLLLKNQVLNLMNFLKSE